MSNKRIQELERASCLTQGEKLHHLGGSGSRCTVHPHQEEPVEDTHSWTPLWRRFRHVLQKGWKTALSFCSYSEEIFILEQTTNGFSMNFQLHLTLVPPLILLSISLISPSLFPDFRWVYRLPRRLISYPQEQQNFCVMIQFVLTGARGVNAVIMSLDQRKMV